MRRPHAGLVARYLQKLGRCPACDKPIRYSDTIAVVHGKRYHERCAVYRQGDRA